MTRKIIQVRILQDDEFVNSHWSFDACRESEKAFQEFQKQFGIGFEITDISRWDSIDFLFPETFPFFPIQAIPRGLSIEKTIEFLLDACWDLKLPVSICQKEKDDIYAKMKGKPLAYQLGFWEARLDSWWEECFFQNLMEKEPIESGTGMVIAFTGKSSFWSRGLGVVISEAEILTKESYIVMRNCLSREKEPSKTILHEIGHLFGAKHTKYISSVMRKGNRSTYKFDLWNRIIISRKIRSIKGFS